jgi:hypothetical protein
VSFTVGAAMAGDPFSLVKDLHYGLCHPNVNLLPHEREGDAIEHVFERYVVIDVDARQSPYGKFIGLSRKWS